ncbi:hypothetical protein ACFC0M_06610 [Streptomyces sp. NPDC056149]
MHGPVARLRSNPCPLYGTTVVELASPAHASGKAATTALITTHP